MGNVFIQLHKGIILEEQTTGIKLMKFREQALEFLSLHAR